MTIQELHEKENFPIVWLCEIAQISRAAYYKWISRTPSQREVENMEIVREMKVLSEEVKGIYGYRRMTMNVSRKLQKTLNHKRIYRLMKLANIQSVIRRKKKRYRSSKPQHIAENLLNREFKATKPNEKMGNRCDRIEIWHFEEGLFKCDS